MIVAWKKRLRVVRMDRVFVLGIPERFRIDTTIHQVTNGLQHLGFVFLVCNTEP